METAVAISHDSFPATGSASAVVLANAFNFPDALAGTPLAAAKHGPLLLSPGDGLDPRVAAEIARVLPAGRTVYVLGGAAAMSSTVTGQLASGGYNVVRYGGVNRFDTAAIIADQGLGHPSIVLEATGTNFPDALAGGAAAVAVHAAILLTNGGTQAPETAAYLSAHPPVGMFALGGPAAAAAPNATPLVGSDRFATSNLVASTFFTRPTIAAIANGFAFPDALAGGAHIGAKGGPLLLVAPSGALPSSVRFYLNDNVATLNSGWAYGGSLAVGDDVLGAASQAMA
jgi:hypothetical protein